MSSTPAVMALVARGALAIALGAGCATPTSSRAPPAAARRYEAPDERFVFFTAAKTDVLLDGYFNIGFVAAQLEADPALRALIVGHADSQGKADTNRELSFKCARAVRKVLADHGVKEARVSVGAPREQGDASHAELSRRADLFVYDPAQDDAVKRVGYPIDVKSE